MSEIELLSPEFASDPLLVAVANGEATLTEGTKNASVLVVQKALELLGEKIKVDGDFGPKTRGVLEAFQVAQGLTQSGRIDAETLVALDERFAEHKRNHLQDTIVAVAGAPRPSGRPTIRNAPAPTDSRYFTDAAELPGVGHPAPDDPDSPPPDVDPNASSMARVAPLGLDRRAMMSQIRESIGDDGAATSALERLLAAGRLHSGKLLPNLAAMATSRRHPDLMTRAGIDTNLPLRQVIRHVDNPLRVTQGVGRGTCGAGVVEYLMLRRDPSEFVRLIDGITGLSGQVKLRSGRVITMPRTAIPRDDTTRIDIDRLFQSTIMNHATAMSWLFDYDNAKDNESFWAAVKGNTQMPIWGFASIYEDVMGESRSSVSFASRSRDEIAELVVAAALKGDRVPVIMQFNSMHWLSVEWPERGADGRTSSLVLRNPWGWDPGGDDPPRQPMPEGGGRIRMNYGDFIRFLVGACIKD